MGWRRPSSGGGSNSNSSDGGSGSKSDISSSNVGNSDTSSLTGSSGSGGSSHISRSSSSGGRNYGFSLEDYTENSLEEDGEAKSVYNLWEGGKEGPLTSNFRRTPRWLPLKMGLCAILNVAFMIGMVLLPVGGPSPRDGVVSTMIAPEEVNVEGAESMTAPAAAERAQAIAAINNKHNFVTTDKDWARYSPWLLGWNAAYLFIIAIDTHFVAAYHFGLPQVRFPVYAPLVILGTVSAVAAAFAIGGLFPLSPLVPLFFFTFACMGALYVSALPHPDKAFVRRQVNRSVNFGTIVQLGIACIIMFAFLFAISWRYPLLQNIELLLFAGAFALLERAYPILKKGTKCDHAFIAIYTDRLILDSISACFSAFAMWPQTTSIGTFFVSGAIEVWTSLFPLVIVSARGQRWVRRWIGTSNVVGFLLLPNKKWSASDTYVRRATSILSNEITRMTAAGLYLICAPLMRNVAFIEVQYLFGPDALCQATFDVTLMYAGFSFGWHLLLTLVLGLYGAMGREDTSPARYVSWRYVIHALDFGYIRAFNNITFGFITAIWLINNNSRTWSWGIATAGSINAHCVDDVSYG